MDFINLNEISVAHLNYCDIGRWLVAATFNGTASWPSNNQAVYVRLRLPRRFKASQLVWGNGANLTGNVDIGIYDANGNRVVSTGSTARSGATAPQLVSIATTMLVPGTYFLAMAASSTTGTYFRGTPNIANMTGAGGAWIEASALPLPATMTLTTMSTSYIPFMGMIKQGAV